MSERDLLIRRTNAATEAFKTQRVRWVTGIAKIKMEIDEKKYKQIVDTIIKDETERQMIIGAIKEKGPLTVEEISQMTSLEASRIMQHIIVLRKRGTIGEGGEKNRQYLYQLI